MDKLTKTVAKASGVTPNAIKVTPVVKTAMKAIKSDRLEAAFIFHSSV
ncbi:hypothetical protein ACIRVK_44415 [Streptomyces sp. NPDC101152]